MERQIDRLSDGLLDIRKNRQTDGGMDEQTETDRPKDGQTDTKTLTPPHTNTQKKCMQT
jgi:hypothetical protein